ncbi:MAG: heterodisulfide reductase-related iron-sulfur binding cluster, partial [Nitrospirota bacterium]|nr:heterodisulfide reductase-related iron-sulfur binding cluster [Nitrospirota bacterium]
WARAASLVPGLANILTQTPVLSDLVKTVGGISTQRRMPPFATQTFTAWFHARPPKHCGGPKVLLWPDTFNNYFFPETAVAAVEVLEACGFHVTIPQRALCCGRPLYDFGMLDLAQSMWRQILDTLHDDIEAGTPIVGLEPSCVAAFRDELLQLNPNLEDAKRLSSHMFTLSEFLDAQAPDIQLPTLHRPAIVHGHCHQKAVMGFQAETTILKRVGLEAKILDSGCCGMAGSFGFQPGDHYDVSLKVGEMVLLPAVRHASKETLVMADGFSCREQIAQTTDRQGLHLAQVLAMAIRYGSDGIQGSFPERHDVTSPAFHRGLSSREVKLLWAVGAAAVGGLLLKRFIQKVR